MLNHLQWIELGQILVFYLSDTVRIRVSVNFEKFGRIGI